METHDARTAGDRAEEMFVENLTEIRGHTDRIFTVLMPLQWFGAVAMAVWVFPLTWSGARSGVNPHVLAAVILGGAITLFPVWVARNSRSSGWTRQIIGLGQVMMSTLLIHLSGGRIETHFHIFGSMAFLAFYLDWKVLVSASAFVAVDHLLRGLYYPQSVYGVYTVEPWRWLEHAGWLIFIDVFILLNIRETLRLTRELSRRQVDLESINKDIEATVRQRTGELAAAQDHLRQSQKMEAVGRLAGGVAHDFNNILTAIIGTSDLLLQEMPPAARERGDIGEIRKSADRAAALTRQLLAFSRKQLLQPRLVNLNSIVGDVELMIARLIGEHIQVTLSLDASLGYLLADPGQIEQVILNLVLNARDAMPRGGRLALRTSLRRMEAGDWARQAGLPPGLYAVLTVDDTGDGMSSETLSRLFEPFFTTKEQGKGTGLGLSTVYGIVKQSGGHVAVSSEAGRGTTFSVYLPCAPESAGRCEEPPALRADPRGAETVLLAEDEEAVRRVAARILRGCGYKVLEASHGAEALKISDGHPEPIALLLTDMVMPKMTGRELAGLLLARRPGLKALYMSGYTDAAVFGQGALPPGLAFLHKPFSARGLAEKVREVLDESRRGFTV